MMRSGTVVLISLAVGISLSCASRSKGTPALPPAEARPAQEEPKPDGLTLAQVLSENVSGLDLEPQEAREKLLKRSRQYLAARKLARKGTDVRQAASSTCARNEEEDPFCPLFGELSATLSAKSASRPAPVAKSTAPSASLAKAWALTGELDSLLKASEQDMRRAIASQSSFDSLKPLAEAVLSRGRCAATAVAAALGSKAEEGFPDPERRQAANQLYERASVCEEKEGLASSFRATYRLTLLQVWGERCDQALPGLQWLVTSEVQHEFGSRARYWQAKCLEKQGDAKAAAVARRELIERYPFSLHGIVLAGADSESVDRVAARPDPQVMFRSAALPRVNGMVRAAEALLASGESLVAGQVLRKISGQAPEMEPEFRIYLAVLLSRSGQYVEKFKILSPLFRQNPMMASRAALELYYPQGGVSSSEMDQMLLLSLIRQESAFNRAARSPAGALGLMQVMPGTAKSIEQRVRKAQLLDPSVNLRIGSKYFVQLARQFDGDVELALAAYNAGPRRVEDWLRRYPVDNRILFVDLIPFKETREYVASIARNYYWYSRLYPAAQGEPREASAVFRMFRSGS